MDVAVVVLQEIALLKNLQAVRRQRLVYGSWICSHLFRVGHDGSPSSESNCW